MTDYYYLDANPLISWAEAQQSKPDSRTTKIASFVDGLLQDPQAVTATSEIGLAEFYNKICTLCRDSAQPSYDAAWTLGIQTLLMEHLAAGRTIVLSPLPRAIETAITYVMTATREHGRALKAWDAAHLCYAATWSREVTTVVRLVTSDGGFESILQVYPAFTRFVSVVDPSV